MTNSPTLMCRAFFRPCHRLPDWISWTGTAWSLPKVPLGSCVGLGLPVPVQVISQVTVARSLYVPSPEERR